MLPLEMLRQGAIVAVQPSSTDLAGIASALISRVETCKLAGLFWRQIVYFPQVQPEGIISKFSLVAFVANIHMSVYIQMFIRVLR